MPVVFRYKGFRFFFYSNEGSPREPVHVHVRAAESYGFDAGTLRELVEVAQANSEMIERAWHEYFG